MTESRIFQNAVGLSLLVLGGCATDTGEIVYFSGPNGQTGQCGPTYHHAGFMLERNQETLEELRNRCIAAYEQDGFQRVPANADR
jgi:hypothetical protein